MMNKLVLRQIAPEYQGKWLVDDLKEMEGFAIYGNSDFIEIDTLDSYGLFDESKMTAFENLIEDFENYIDYNDDDSEEYMKSIEYYIHTKLTDEKMLAIKKTIIEYIENEFDVDYEEMIIKIIEIIDGRKLEKTTIRGCCQREWQEMIYDPEMVDPREIEAYYFNTGSEWEIGHIGYKDDEEIDFETAELDFGTQYTTEWSTDNIKKEFAEWYNIDEKDVIMLEFDGWKKTAHYKRV